MPARAVAGATRACCPGIMIGIVGGHGQAVLLGVIGFLVIDRLRAAARPCPAMDRDRADGGRGGLPVRAMVADPAARRSIPRQLVLWGSLVAAAGAAMTGLAQGVYGSPSASRWPRWASACSGPASPAAPRSRSALDEQNEVAGQVTSVNGVAFVAGPALGVGALRLGLPLPFLATAALMLGLAAWTGLALQPFGPRGVSMPGAMKPMPPPAPRASCFRLSWICSYSRSISGVTEARVSFERALELGHRHLARPRSSRAARCRPARRTRSSRSAPVKRSVRSASASRSTSLASGMPLVWMPRMWRRPAASGTGDVDQFVEAAGPEQRRIDQVRPVGGADHHDRLQLLEPVHLGEDGVDHALGDLRLAEAAAARGDEAVELVDEDHGRRDLAGAGEQAGDLLLALAIPFGEQVGRFGGDEIGLAPRAPSPWRAGSCRCRAGRRAGSPWPGGCRAGGRRRDA